MSKRKYSNFDGANFNNYRYTPYERDTTMGTPNLTGPSEVPTDAKRMEQAICELCGNPFLREVGSKETVCKRKDEVLHWKLLPDKHDGIEKLMRIHYKFFMANDRFWYEKDLIEADAIICIAASNLRKELANG